MARNIRSQTPADKPVREPSEGRRMTRQQKQRAMTYSPTPPLTSLPVSSPSPLPQRRTRSQSGVASAAQGGRGRSRSQASVALPRKRKGTPKTKADSLDVPVVNVVDEKPDGKKSRANNLDADGADAPGGASADAAERSTIRAAATHGDVRQQDMPVSSRNRPLEDTLAVGSSSSTSSSTTKAPSNAAEASSLSLFLQESVSSIPSVSMSLSSSCNSPSPLLCSSLRSPNPLTSIPGRKRGKHLKINDKSVASATPEMSTGVEDAALAAEQETGRAHESLKGKAPEHEALDQTLAPLHVPTEQDNTSAQSSTTRRHGQKQRTRAHNVAQLHLSLPDAAVPARRLREDGDVGGVPTPPRRLHSNPSTARGDGGGERGSSRLTMSSNSGVMMRAQMQGGVGGGVQGVRTVRRSLTHEPSSLRARSQLRPFGGR